MNTHSDLELWRLVKEKNRAAFEILYKKYWESSYTTVYWLLLDQESAKDIVQELFVDLWVKRDQINISATFEGYLKIALRNRVFSYIKSAARQKVRTEGMKRDADAVAITAQEIYNEKELRKLFRAEVEKLPPKMKEILVLNIEDGLPVREIAQKLTLSEQTVRNQLSNSIKRVRAGLECYRLLSIIMMIYLYYIS
ncbi:RNA polymerase sigma factor [Taibaiella helva]|uniref:RNA polymerase sigma factor n=1 Tax=Taibaiella helva TaxID=2301235 RepID=UPI00130078D1|nr:sigma-70 family RNA polymerase sigma factor [Taibaiella helva]